MAALVSGWATLFFCSSKQASLNMAWVERRTFVTCIIDDEPLSRSQSCPAEFFVDKVIAAALAREVSKREKHKRKKKRITKQQQQRERDAEENALLDSCMSSVAAEGRGLCESQEAEEPPKPLKTRPGARLAQRRRENEQAKESFDIGYMDQTPAEYIMLITGSGIRGVAYDPGKSTTSLRQLLLHLNGYSQESNLRMHCSTNHAVVRDGVTLRDAGILPRISVYLAARGKEKTIRIGR